MPSSDSEPSDAMKQKLGLLEANRSPKIECFKMRS